MAGDFRPCIAAHDLVTKDDPGDLDLFLELAAAMVGEAGVVVADDPGPVEPAGELGQQCAGLIGQALAAESVVEAVAEAEQPPGAGALDFAGERAQRRMRIIGREELTEPREPARLLKVQIGNEQRFLARPEQRAVSGCEECFAGERKGNHAAGVTPASGSI